MDGNGEGRRETWTKYPARQRRGNRETAAGRILLFDSCRLVVETLRLCQQIWEGRINIGFRSIDRLGLTRFGTRGWVTRITAPRHARDSRPNRRFLCDAAVTMEAHCRLEIVKQWNLEECDAVHVLLPHAVQKRCGFGPVECISRSHLLGLSEIPFPNCLPVHRWPLEGP
jgi:hypothetical protein